MLMTVVSTGEKKIKLGQVKNNLTSNNGDTIEVEPDIGRKNIFK